ncbi:MAG TPA: hypothetical protein VFK06_02680 [Candidatus Angelobacter sp.]|nr:hypothetical protein [Candidatus Angelobacter sp.]
MRELSQHGDVVRDLTCVSKRDNLAQSALVAQFVADTGAVAVIGQPGKFDAAAVVAYPLARDEVAALQPKAALKCSLMGSRVTRPRTAKLSVPLIPFSI